MQKNAGDADKRVVALKKWKRRKRYLANRVQMFNRIGNFVVSDLYLTQARDHELKKPV